METEPLFKEVLDLATDPMLLVSPENYSIINANLSACELFGYSRQQFVGMKYATLGTNPVVFRRALVNKLTFASGMEHLGKDDKVFTADVSFEYLNFQGKAMCIAVIRNLADPDQIKNARAEHERLALEVLHTDSAFFMGEEYERRRLEHELHGHIGPMVVSLKLDMEKNLADGQETIPRKELERMRRKLTEAITELRIVTSRLAEGFQYQKDPVRAIGNLMDKFSEYGDLKVYCQLDPLPENVDMSLRYHLFRIVEEGLTNIVKHADATKIVLRMRVSDDWLQMHLYDNGQGMGEQSIKSGPGLRLMQKRAELLSGTIRFESAKGKYFKLDLEVPLA